MRNRVLPLPMRSLSNAIRQIASSFVIGQRIVDGEHPVHLLAKHHPEQLMRERRLAERQDEIGFRAKLVGVTVAAAYKKRKLAFAVVALCFYQISKGFA